MKLRNKKYLLQMKNIVEKIQKQEHKPKKRQNRHHNTVFYNHKANTSNPPSPYTNEIPQTPAEPIQSTSTLFHRYNSLTPQKYFTDQKIMKLQKFSQKLKTFYLPITAPFESQMILRLELLEGGKVKLIKQTGFQDDFTVNIRLNNFQEDHKKIEEKQIKNKITLPTLQQEDEDEELTDEEINMKKLANYNKKNAYKNILKYNPRTLQSLIDKSQLGQSKIKACPKQPNQHHIALLQRSVTTNVSPFNNTNISTASPISSIQLLREKRIKPKLLPLENKPLSKFALTHNSPTKLSSTKLSMKKGFCRSILSTSGKKYQKKITFGQLIYTFDKIQQLQ